MTTSWPSFFLLPNSVTFPYPKYVNPNRTAQHSVSIAESAFQKTLTCCNDLAQLLCQPTSELLATIDFITIVLLFPEGHILRII